MCNTHTHHRFMFAYAHMMIRCPHIHTVSTLAHDKDRESVRKEEGKREIERGGILFHTVINFFLLELNLSEIWVLFFFSPFPSSPTPTPPFPSDVKLNSSSTQLDVAALQNSITHVKSPLPKSSCVTPVDHIMILFLHCFGYDQSITQQSPALFSFD